MWRHESNKSRTIVRAVYQFPVGRLSLPYAKALVQKVLQRAVVSHLNPVRISLSQASNSARSNLLKPKDDFD